jgi:hypothetical protein
MIRRLITACVLTGMLAAQWAVVPHSHGSSTEPSHDNAPHVHLSFGEHGHHHSHDEKHAHCHQAAKTADDAAAPASSVCNGESHDADAVYFAGGDSPSAPVSVQKCPDQSPTAQPFALSVAVCDVIDCLTASVESANTPAENEAPSCARFLTLRTLRI